ncbi:MAG TPA: hypothetical protein PLJ47_08050 [Candidatus Hydrogenedentes bacterium]|nr:hypothetical protein [Candidatus Hydrogenedentota bacterium]
MKRILFVLVLGTLLVFFLWIGLAPSAPPPAQTPKPRSQIETAARQPSAPATRDAPNVPRLPRVQLRDASNLDVVPTAPVAPATVSQFDRKPTEVEPDAILSYGSVTGTITGLNEGESAGVFAVKGEFSLGNVTEDDLYDFGEIAASEARMREDGTYALTGLQAGRYTIIGIVENFAEENGKSARDFWYVTTVVDVPEEGNAEADLAF